MRKTAFIKISGDLISREDVLSWIQSITDDYSVVICPGGGSQISEEFSKKNIPITFGPLGREIEKIEDRQLAQGVLEKNRAEIQNALETRSIDAAVVTPVLNIGSILCHVNGDVYTRAAYNGFDKIYILTLAERLAKKKEEFGGYPKIEVVGFPTMKNV